MTLRWVTWRVRLWTQSVLRSSDVDHACHDLDADAAEPFTKKRVAFKDDVVDGAEMGDRVNPSLAARRSVMPPLPPSHDELSAPPAATPSPPPRPNRLGLRARPGGVGSAGRRPVAR